MGQRVSTNSLSRDENEAENGENSRLNQPEENQQPIEEEQREDVNVNDQNSMEDQNIEIHRNVQDWLFRPNPIPNFEVSALSEISGVRILPPKPYKTNSVKCPVNLIKSSLQLIPVDDTKKHYRLQFIFDCSERCSIQIYYVATETKDENQYSSFSPKLDLSCCMFERGLGQLYSQPEHLYLDISKHKEGDLFYSQESITYPVVIVLQTEKKIKHEAISQITYATLLHCDDNWVIKPIKQNIWYNERSFVIYEIFGAENESDGSRECVVCMTESRDTTVLPCRHLCLCNLCAEKLRQQSNKCPICRTAIKSMVEVSLSKIEDSDEEDEDVLLKKKSKLEV